MSPKPQQESIDESRGPLIAEKSSNDELTSQLLEEARRVKEQEPELTTLLHRTVLAPSVQSFEDAVASTVCYRLLLHPCRESSGPTSASAAHLPSPMFCPDSLRDSIKSAVQSNVLELGHSMKEAIREDALSVCRRDPATDTLLEVVLFSKGYAALVCHRAAHRLWHSGKKFTALFLQSQASAVFGLDIHPLARMGSGIMLDHGTGIVIGETAVVGDGCTLLHGVTLGGTGKDHGDRHPKIGKNVLIGAGTSILGNISVGDSAKVGAGSVVLRSIPAGATAVGAPAKIIGRVTESKPGSDVDETLMNVSLLHQSESMINLKRPLAVSSSSTGTLTTEPETEEDDSSGSDGGAPASYGCPWREYTKMAKLAPPNTITICTLRKLLVPEGCTFAEVGNCLFELDTMNVGHVHMDVFRERAVEVITMHTALKEERVEQIVTTFFVNYNEKSRRASLALGPDCNSPSSTATSSSVAVH